MTLKSWKEEFYPVKASSKEAKADAAAHSLRKWQGLTKANLKKHGLVPWQIGNQNFFIYGIKEFIHGIKQPNAKSGERMMMNASSCSLCCKNEQSGITHCEDCSLAKVRADRINMLFTPCTVPRRDEVNSPWTAWTVYGDPKPMIRWLKKAVAYEKKQAKKETK